VRLPIAFGVSPDSLAVGTPDTAAHVGCHRDLLSLWARFGVFVHADDEEVLAARVRDLPVPVRKLWQEILATGRRRRNPVCSYLRDPLRPVDAMRLRGAIALGLVTPISARQCGASGDQPSAHLPDAAVELCRFDLARHSEHFRWAERVSGEGIIKGSDLNALWAERFEGFLSWATHVVVVDRYCVADHLWARQNPSGLTRLFNTVANSPSARSVQVFTAYSTKYPREDVINALRQAWRRSDGARGGATAHVRICDDRRFGAIAHHRWLRLDRVLVRLDKGLADLSGRRANRSSPLSIVVVDMETRNLEEELRRSCDEHVLS
jgi:hypothetical protein